MGKKDLFIIASRSSRGIIINYVIIIITHKFVCDETCMASKYFQVGSPYDSHNWPIHSIISMTVI